MSEATEEEECGVSHTGHTPSTGARHSPASSLSGQGKVCMVTNVARASGISRQMLTPTFM